MRSRGADDDWLREQYSDAERLAIRQETHARYGRGPEESLFSWVTRRLRLGPGDRVLDLGCGNGPYLGGFRAAGAWSVAADRSIGMLRGIGAASVARVVGDAARIPLADRSVDAVAANHMLYHVPRPKEALREMRRVLVDGGRVVVATNAADAQAELRRIHREAAAELGLTPALPASTRFTLDDLDVVREVFPDARVERRESALVFPAVEPVLRYYGSGMVGAILDPPADGSHRAPLLRLVEARVRATIERVGVFRSGSAAGCFSATRRPAERAE